MDKAIVNYCVGCGLCKGLGRAIIETDDNGFYHPIEGDFNFLHNVCPSAGIQKSWMDGSFVWGRSLKTMIGWANEPKIRERGASGGILTQLVIYLIEQKKIDGVLHIMPDPDDVTRTIPCISYSREEIIQRAGSRYSISHPLEIVSSLDKTKKYAVIAKPCDIIALRNYINISSELKTLFPYLFSFFCMGLPSVQAQESLLAKLEVTKSDCISLSYRGDGWPGYTKVVDKNGKTKQMTYSESWGKILGRDLMLACRFCMDGIGEAADISCSDAWYLTADGKPDFSEHEGRNVIFARTEVGKELLLEAEKAKIIHLEDYKNAENELKKIQASQFKRRVFLRSRLLAMKFFGKTVPQCDSALLKAYSMNVSGRERLKEFLGTIKRILKKRL